jgi:hypothetical protein
VRFADMLRAARFELFGVGFSDTCCELPVSLSGAASQFNRSEPPVNGKEPIREVQIHDEGFAAIRLSMMRIMARRTKATVVCA